MRETASLRFWIVHRRQVPWRVFKHPCFWQDNLWTPLNRLVGCRFGHRRIDKAEDSMGGLKKFCFACYRDVR